MEGVGFMWRSALYYEEALEAVQRTWRFLSLFFEVSICFHSLYLNCLISDYLILTDIYQTSTHGLETRHLP